MDAETFSTEVKADIYGLDKFLKKPDLDYSDATLTIKWMVEPDVRNWGIKGITITIKKVIGSIYYSVEDEECELELDSDKFEIESLMNFSDSGSAYPSSIEIDFEKMKIVVE